MENTVRILIEMNDKILDENEGRLNENVTTLGRM